MGGSTQENTYSFDRDPEAFPLPREYQQTLRRSFTLGGIGLQTGEYAHVRVRPALAGEGRYFVRVPEGTNSHLFRLEQPEKRTMEDLDVSPPDEDPYEEQRTKIFFDWLEARDEGYDGNLDEYTEEHGGSFNDLFPEDAGLDDPSLPDEEAQPRRDDEPWIPAHISTARALSPHHLALERGSERVLSPEALLSCLEACGIDCARIEIEGGPEVPVLDGTGFVWATELRGAGVKPAGPARRPAPQPDFSDPGDGAVLSVGDGDSFIHFHPGSRPRLTAGLESDVDAIGRQWYTWIPPLASPDASYRPTPEEEATHYRYEIAPAHRCFESMGAVLELMRQGLLKGGADRVALVAGKADWLDASIARFPSDGTEPTRHAIQQLLGVLALAAPPGSKALPRGHLVAYRASLDLQLEFATKLAERLVGM